MSFKDKFTSRKLRVFLFNVLAMCLFVLLVIFGVFQWLNSYTHHGEAVTVPEMKGLSLAEAARKLESLELSYVVSDSVYIKTMPAGSVLEYTPAEGQKVKRGRVIYFTLNTLSIPLVNVPDVSDNSSLRQAEARLLAAGFKIDEIELVEGERDWVYGVKYNGRVLLSGEKVPDGSVLSLRVGGGEDFEPDSLLQDSDSLILSHQVSTKNNNPASDKDDDSWF